MRNSKDRTIQKKRVNKANKITRTQASRARRISNKHKRQEIHDIDPKLKVFVMNEKTYDINGNKIEVIDGKIKITTPADYEEALIEYQKVVDNEAVIEKIEARNKSTFKRLTDKLRGD
jgi:hypothetical protein